MGWTTSDGAHGSRRDDRLVPLTKLPNDVLRLLRLAHVSTTTGYVRAMATDMDNLRFRIRNMRELLQNDVTGRTKENAETSEVARMVEEVLGMVDEIASAVQDLDTRGDD